jgi:hypothetical protein
MEDAASKPGFKGCLVGTFSQEAEAIGPQLSALCDKSFEAASAFFTAEFKKAIHKYPPSIPVDPETLADFFLSGIQGSFVLMKARRDNRIVRSNISLMRGYLKSIFGK